jgi:hypothetical protein
MLNSVLPRRPIAPNQEKEQGPQIEDDLSHDGVDEKKKSSEA